jgi:hypothetical protein
MVAGEHSVTTLPMDLRPILGNCEEIIIPLGRTSPLRR